MSALKLPELIRAANQRSNETSAKMKALLSRAGNRDLSGAALAQWNTLAQQCLRENLAAADLRILQLENQVASLTERFNIRFPERINYG